MQAYPTVPAMRNTSLRQKIRNEIVIEVLNAMVVKLRFRIIYATACMVLSQFPREFSPNEAHSYAYLPQHEDFNVSQKEEQAKRKKLLAHGY